MAFDLIVNGGRHRVDADPQTPLLWVIRDHLGLTGTKFSCGIGQCGACTVHVDGRAIRSCSVPAAAAIGKPVTDHRRRVTRRDPPDPGGLEGVRHAAVRVLPARHDHERAGAPARASAPHRRRHRHPNHQRLPVWQLSPRQAGHPSRRRPDGEGAMSSDVTRREFLATVAAAQGAFVLGFWMPDKAHAQAQRWRRPAPGAVWYEESATPEVNAWIVIAPDDTVTIRIAQTELGQGVWTSNAMMVCEELQCDWTKVRPQYASANRDAREKAPEWTLEVPGNGADRPEGRRGADVRQSRSDRRVRHSRQPVSAHANQRRVLGEGWPVLPAACRCRGARAVAARRRGRVAGAGDRADGQGQRHHARVERPDDDLRPHRANAPRRRRTRTRERSPSSRRTNGR